MKRWRFWQREPSRNCYWVAVHFADAESAARFANENMNAGSISGGTRLLRTNESIPVCREE